MIIVRCNLKTYEEPWNAATEPSVATKAAAVNFMIEKDADVITNEGKLWAFMMRSVPRIFRVHRTYVTVSPLDECVSLSSDKDNVKSVPFENSEQLP